MPPKLRFDLVLEDLLGLPKSLLKTLRFYLDESGKTYLSQMRNWVKVHNIRRIIFTGHSYNHFASMIPFYMINTPDRSCYRYEVDEFLNYFEPCKFHDDTVFVLVSSSGESVQVQRVVEKLKNAGIAEEAIWGISNNKTSFLSKNAFRFFPIFAGEERVQGTLSYSNLILLLNFISRAFLDLDPIPSKLESEIRQLIFEIKFYGQDWEYHVKSLAEFLGKDYEFLYFISKGASLATAQQAALSCKSYAQLYGEGMNIGLFLHGPFQIIRSDPESFRSVIILGDESNFEYTVKLIETVSKKFGSGKVILINNSRQLSSLGRSNSNVWVFEHTTRNSFISPIFEIVVLQFLLLDLALRRGVVS